MLHSEGEERDWHAGQAETSLMMYWCPELVRTEEIELDSNDTARMMRTDPDWYAKQEKNIDTEFTIPHIHQREEIEVGVMGFPHLASKELGELMSREMEEGLLKFFKKLEEETE